MSATKLCKWPRKAKKEKRKKDRPLLAKIPTLTLMGFSQIQSNPSAYCDCEAEESNFDDHWPLDRYI